MFDRVSAFNMSTGFKERSYKNHWHSHGEIIQVGPGNENIYSVGNDTFRLVQDDLLLIWPMELHEKTDADRMALICVRAVPQKA